MNYFQVESWPDALRTLRRLAVCFIPAFVAAIIMRPEHNTSRDPVQFHELIQFEQALAAGLLLVIFSGTVMLFCLWQAVTRNILTDECGLGWLSIHGWEGEAHILPQRGLLPISEIIGMLLVTLICGRREPAAFVFLPMSWSVIRLALCKRITAQNHSTIFGTVWLIHATAVLWSETIWLAVPVELSAIVLTECLLVYELRRKSSEALTNDVTIVTKQSNPFLSNASPERGRMMANRGTLRLFPFSQLSATDDDKRPSWAMSIRIAIIIAWVMFCMTNRASHFASWETQSGIVMSVQGLFGLAGMSVILVVGLLWKLVQNEPFVWNPRISVMTRIRLLRPIIWSWDRILLPHALNGIILVLANLFWMSMTPTVFALLAFAEVLILLRCGVSSEEWQMTSDSRLVTTFLSN